MAEVPKIDSNVTGLSIAEEETLGVLPASPIWYAMEPNTYNDFGGNLTLVARNPINPTRQRRKGVITDLDASGGLNQDLTFTNLDYLWEGLLLAIKRQKATNSVGATDADDQILSVSAGPTGGYELGVGGGAKYQAGSLIFATGFADALNNGLKVVTGVTGDTLEIADTVLDAAPAADARIKLVGHEFAAGDASITKGANALPTLDSVADDLTSFNLIPGETIYIGGDDTGATGDAFDAASNNGFARVALAPTATTLTFDKTSGGADGTTEMVTETGGTKAIRIFFGDITRNESSVSPQFDRKTWTLERSLGEPNPISQPGVIQSELLRGSVVNEFALNIPQADKITTDWTFVSIDNQQRDGNNPGASGGDERLLSTTVGSFASIEEATAYNTSSDFSRIKLAVIRPTQGGASELSAPTPLFAFVTNLTLNVNNNATPNKAVGVLGAFDVTAGTLEVSGDITAYFADVAATRAVRDNADVTLDVAIVKDFGTGLLRRKTGIVIDVPLIALGDGRLTVAQDEAIQVPLTTDAAVYEPFDHTLVIHEFQYLPESSDT